MNSYLYNKLKVAEQELSTILKMPGAAALPDPLRMKLSAVVASLSECERQAMQMQRDFESRNARITDLARELMSLGEVTERAAEMAERPEMPAPPPFPRQADKTSEPTEAPVTATPFTAAPAAEGGRFIAEGVSMISRSTVSPTCEAFVFAIMDTAGSVQKVRIETYRLDGKIFVKTRSALAGANTGWVRGEDGYGDFFLCYEDKVASITDKKIRMAAAFAMS